VIIQQRIDAGGMKVVSEERPLSSMDFASLPPIAAMRAFEAAARLQSFTRAAKELGLTQGAISHQIRALERQLGFDLFRRDPRETVLTHRGEELAEAVRDGLGRIASAIQVHKRGDTRRQLTVSMPPGFAAKWLLPRLIRFDRRESGVDVAIHTSAAIVDFADGQVDAAIRYGTGRYPGLHVERVLGEEIFPVCARALVDQSDGLKRPQDLVRFPLLHDDHWRLENFRPSWRMWAERAGIAGLATDQGRSFDQALLVTQAAIEGLGVALGRSALVDEDIRSGRLVRPFGPSIPSPFAFYFVCLPGTLADARAARFLAWVQVEAKPAS
jgi:LysR family glycine cleavage system transcriptional activator